MQLRRNHAGKGSLEKTFLLRIFMIFGIIAYLVWYLSNRPAFLAIFFSKTPQQDSLTYSGDIRTYIPQSDGQLLHKRSFSLAWNPDTKIANWVAYRLSKKQLGARNFQERFAFESDAQIHASCPSPADYNSSGFDRGHLVPAADMSWDSISLRESFLMSNISPQKRGFNVGVWKELEKLTRDWVYDLDSVIIITGPVFQYRDQPLQFGASNVHIPTHYFKIVCQEIQYQGKCIGFVIPNEVTYEPLRNYIKSIDEIEDITGFNFFHFMWDEKIQEQVESKADTSRFPFDEYKYNQRIQVWNYQ